MRVRGCTSFYRQIRKPKHREPPQCFCLTTTAPGNSIDLSWIISRYGPEAHAPFTETAWYSASTRVWCRPMGHCKGKDNKKKTAARRQKAERLKAAKAPATQAK